MARPLRIQFENAYYHVTCRGNARQEIFRDDEDRESFLKLLGRSIKTYHTGILAYVMMVNHFHLMVKTPRGNLQEFMRHFNISYTSYFNRRWKRSGHLYQGRYKSFLIDADHYLQEVSRYIHLNPVRVRDMDNLSAEEKRMYLLKYAWSSYPGYLARRKQRDFLQSGEILEFFGGDQAGRRKSYEQFVMEGMVGDLTSPLVKGKGHGIIGELDFIQVIRDRFLKRSVRHREMPAIRKVVGRIEPERLLGVASIVTGTRREDLLEKGKRSLERALLMEILYRYGGMNQREIGEMLGVDYSSVSIARKRYNEAANKNNKISRIEKKVEKVLIQE